jgi:glycosyltransferase involved in cell wall biosynthesis
MTGRPLRIAVLGTRGIPDVMGGVETHCQLLYPRLAMNGHRIFLFARNGYTEHEAPYDFQGVRVIPIFAPRQKYLEAILHTAYGLLRIAFAKKRYDLIHIHAIGPALLAPFARLLGLKIVMTHHGPEYDRLKWGKSAKLVLRLGERMGCLFSHTIITVAPYISDLVEKRFHRQTHFIPNGVLPHDFLPPGEFLGKWGIREKKYILTVGRLVPEKGFHDLVEAFSALSSDWNLVIAGTADHKDQYTKDLERMALSDERIVMTGFVKGRELSELYSNAGLFVLPSYHEGLPIVALEAMSYKLPILASDIPANREIADPEEMFPVGNVAALHNKMAEFLAEPWPPARKRHLIETVYNWERIAEQTEKVYQSLFSSDLKNNCKLT